MRPNLSAPTVQSRIGNLNLRPLCGSLKRSWVRLNQIVDAARVFKFFVLNPLQMAYFIQAFLKQNGCDLLKIFYLSIYLSIYYFRGLEMVVEGP